MEGGKKEVPAISISRNDVSYYGSKVRVVGREI